MASLVLPSFTVVVERRKPTKKKQGKASFSVSSVTFNIPETVSGAKRIRKQIQDNLDLFQNIPVAVHLPAQGSDGSGRWELINHMDVLTNKDAASYRLNYWYTGLVSGPAMTKAFDRPKFAINAPKPKPQRSGKKAKAVSKKA
jgi:hypothetical protein